MRRLDKEITDQTILDEILHNSQVVRVAFSIDNVPHIVPLSFGYFDNKLFIHSATEGSKIEMIRKNNYVCFEMELHSEIMKDNIACNWTTKYRSIIGWGRIFIIEDHEEKIKGLDVIMEKYGWTHPQPIHRLPKLYGGQAGGEQYNENTLNRMVLLVIEIEKYAGKQSGDW